MIKINFEEVWAIHTYGAIWFNADGKEIPDNA